ncbi:long-chain acyl-CoA synthetase [Nakamurella sp. UYEF19]|uniref:AMP-binding protein n=1 Tax=Nakamurella sp. UYEF19 TaxID=1756392 RepID=UPI0033979B7E
MPDLVVAEPGSAAPTPRSGAGSPSPDRNWSHHADGSRVRNIADILRRRAVATPDAPAVLQGDRVTTYGELDDRSSRVACALLADGVVAGDRVAYVGVNAPPFLEVLYGAAKIGAIATALNNRLARPELLAILANAEPAVLVQGAHEPEIPLGATASLRRVVRADEYETWLTGQPADDPGVEPDPQDPAVIFYSSGTTGLPKGIVLTGDNMSQALAVLNHDVEFDATSVAMAPIPFFHISGFGIAVVATLNGSALLLETETEPPALVRMLVARKVSHAAVVPTLVQRLVNLPVAAVADWSALKYLIYGSAPMPLPIIQRATALFGCKFLSSYGLTESNGGVTFLGPEDHFPAPGREQQLRSVGRVMPGVELKVVDPSTLQDVPVGSRGEVLIRGGHVMLGYWQNPEATAAAVMPDGWLRTGDGGSFDELGYLYLHDRLKDMIVTGGENVFPAEVESALTAHPGVAEIAVVGIPSAAWGESPYAVVVRAPGPELSESELIGWARDRLAHFKCPVGVEFVSALPRNASGKLLKNRLREQVTPLRPPPQTPPRPAQ